MDADQLGRNFGILGGYVLVLAVVSYYVTRYAVRSS